MARSSVLIRPDF